MPLQSRGSAPPDSLPTSRPEPEPLATVLIAEDHEDSRDALRTLLEAFGYRVHVAANGREAIERALATQPDLILMDIMMPEVDGYQATAQIRKLPGFGRVPVLALTANAMPGDREKCLAAGCVDFVTKPVDAAQLFEALRRAVDSRGCQ